MSWQGLHKSRGQAVMVQLWWGSRLLPSIMLSTPLSSNLKKSPLPNISSLQSWASHQELQAVPTQSSFVLEEKPSLKAKSAHSFRVTPELLNSTSVTLARLKGKDLWFLQVKNGKNRCVGKNQITRV